VNCRTAFLVSDRSKPGQQNAWAGGTLRSNDVMMALVRKCGVAFTNNPGDWKRVRFEKHTDLAPQEILRQLAARDATDRASGGGLKISSFLGLNNTDLILRSGVFAAYRRIGYRGAS
jgi:hypothetical protein